MMTFEVGTRDGQVVLILTVADGAGISATSCPMEADEARELCNSLGEAIQDVSRAGVMT
jgi:hypothetical protein